MGSGTQENIKKAAKTTKATVKGYAESAVSNPLENYLTAGAYSGTKGAKAGLETAMAKDIPDVALPALPSAPGDQGSAANKLNRARLLTRNKASKRKGRRSTLLTGPGGIEETAATSRKTLLG